MAGCFVGCLASLWLVLGCFGWFVGNLGDLSMVWLACG